MPNGGHDNLAYQCVLLTFSILSTINKLFDNVKNDADFCSIADGDEEISGIGEFSPSLLRSPRSSLSMFILDVILSIKYVYK